MASRIFGSGIKRREDPGLLTGQSKFTDDFTLPNLAHLAVARSPYAHARIKAIRTKKAAGMPGVLGVYTGRDMKEAGFGPIPCAWVVPGSEAKTPPYPPIAIDTVRYVGNAVAIVVATDRYAARDAADAIEVDYEPLPVAVESRKATGEGGAAAPRGRAEQCRLPLEGVGRRRRRSLPLRRRRRQGPDRQPAPDSERDRAARGHGAVDPATGEFTLWVTSQNPHIARFLLSIDTGTPEHKIRVIAPEVGGGFGSKLPHYPEDSMVVFAAKTLGRPVKWTETRSENYRATIHGRDHIQEVEMAAKKEGRSSGCARPSGPTWAPSSRPLRPACPRSCTGSCCPGPTGFPRSARTSSGSSPTRRRWTRTAARAAPKRRFSSRRWSTASPANSSSIRPTSARRI
jgi:carbon-monoxide dehydrogenase large subunit